MIELVVARYTENLNWLRNLPPNLIVTVYDKGNTGSTPDAERSGSPPDDRFIALPNVGREAHTYLQHIVSRYDSLAEWTIFCQGKPFDHAYDFKKTVREFVAAKSSRNSRNAPPTPDSVPETDDQTGFKWLGHLIDTDDKQGNRLFRPWSKNEDGRGLDIEGFHRAVFDTAGPELYTFVLGAQFIVHRDVVHRQPLTFYERALAVSVNFPDAAHCFERTWDRVFGVTGIDPEWLGDRLTVYLKPMKSQTTVREE